MIVVVDNYDSFTYNLTHLIRCAAPGTPLRVVRNDQVTIEQIAALAPSGIVISPGPGRPEDAGVSMEIVREFSESIPMLGVCLGHQCIATALGGSVVPAKSLMHGKASRIYHDGDGLFAGVPSPVVAARYHSLALDRPSFPDELAVTAWTQDGEIMAIRHRRWPLFGVQFHPESFLSDQGTQIVSNFLEFSRRPQPVC